MATTTYIILRRTDDEEFWRQDASKVEATSAASAIRKAAEKEGTLVAIPERSFQPTLVTFQTQTVLKLGTA